jgi:hypothetical protein
MKEREDPASKYWICDDCAKSKGYKPPEGAVTGIMGICGHCCVTRGLLIPVIDYQLGRDWG